MTLRFADPGDNPDNPFHQSDGRPYADDEVLVAELDPGDWLEFELSGTTDVTFARAVGPDGTEARVDYERTPRGLRIIATAPATVARVVLNPGAGLDTVVRP